MMRIFAFFLLAAGAVPAAEIDTILGELTAITSMAVKSPVSQETMARGDLAGYFESRINEIVKPEELRIEEVTLKKFGLVPRDFDLKKSTVDLMAEQAAAFYDYRKKKMVLLDGPADMMQTMALIHELAHALADQHHNLERFLSKAASSDDSTLARTAVMEGQATYLMSEVLARRMGQSLRDKPETVEMMSRMATGAGAGPVFESVPLYLRESLLFPYAAGMRFQAHVVSKLGDDAFHAVFRNPPSSTRQILHPETYFAGEPPASLSLPNPRRKRDWRVLNEGTLGEFDHQILLRQYSPDDESLAAEWRGGRYRIFEKKKGGGIGLIYRSRWSSESKARAFLKAYREVLNGKSKSCRFETDRSDELTGSNDEGPFAVTVEGTDVFIAEGF